MTVIHRDCERFRISRGNSDVADVFRTSVILGTYLEQEINKQRQQLDDFRPFLEVRDLKSYTHDRSIARMVYLPSFGWFFLVFM